MPTNKINTKVDRITLVPEEFLSKIPASEGEIYDAVVALLGRLDVRNGSFVVNKKNVQIVSQISALLRQVLLGSSYVDAVTEFVAQFDQQTVINRDLFEQLFPGFTGSELADQIMQVAKREAVELFLNQASATDFVAPLRDVIQQAVYNGQGYGETLTNIRNFIQGQGDELGALEKYSKTYAHDTFAVADRSYTAVVGQELKAEWYFYSGGTIATTRAFCRERHGQYFHIKEIEGWFASPVIHQKGQQTPQITSRNGVVGVHWEGMWMGETFDTFFTYAGGYNCGHSVLPVSAFGVPKPVLERNIASGNYKPSKNERERLGLAQE